MDGLTKTGSLIFGIAIGVLGIIHLIMANQIAAGLPSFFAPVFWVYLSGLALLATSISIITKKYTRLACLLLALLFIILVLAVDIPAVFNQQAGYSVLANLFKDISLAGGSLVIASALSKPEPL
jgi:putative oxidoreductase